MLNVDSAKKNAFNEVSAAMMLDSQGNIFETFQSYSICAAFMTHNISLDAKDDIKVSDTTLEFIFLSLKCLERLKILAQTILKERTTEQEQAASFNDSNNMKNLINFKLLNNNSCGVESSNILQIKSPMELALERNKIIYQNFQLRLFDHKYTPQESASMKLALERKMSENVCLAKKQEQLISKKQLESLNSCLKSNAFQNLEEKQFFVDVIHFESNNIWLHNLRKTKEAEFSDSYFVENSIRLILCTNCHPISMYLSLEKEKILKDACNILDENQLVTCNERISQQCNKILGCLKSLYRNVESRFLITYEHFKSESAQLLLHQFLEQYIFDETTTMQIIKLYRLNTQDMEVKLSQIFVNHVNLKPIECGVSNSYTLPNNSQPYQSVVINLANVMYFNLPTKKMSCIVGCMQLVCDSYKEYCAENDVKYLGLGADELVPILVFILIKSGSPTLITHIYALMDYLDEKSSIGEEGYCLTSFLTAFDSILNSTQFNTTI